ncbi:MAG: ABC transporter permease [Vicinamibacterales bacterium]
MRWRSHPGRRRPADPELDAEIRAEIDAHVALRTGDNVRRGLAPDDARREALGRFGDQDRVRDASARIRRRARSRRRTWGIDLRQAWTSLRRAPAVLAAGIAVATVGLSAAFAVARVGDALLVRAPAGLRDPAALRSVLDSPDGAHPVMMQAAVVRGLESALPRLGVFAWSHRDVQVIHAGGRTTAVASLVTGGYFGTLGTRASAGRLLTPADDGGAVAVAVVSRHLAGTLAASPGAAVGRDLMINGRAFVVVGVAERGFRGIEAGHPVDVWLPLGIEPDISKPSTFPDGTVVRGFLHTPGIGWLRGGFRLPPGATDTAVADELTTVMRPLGAHGATDDRRALVTRDPWISPWSGDRDQLVAPFRALGWAMALSLVLTAACLGSLFAGRLSGRRHELGVRLALGAERARLVRAAAAEVVLVTTAGAIVAAPVASLLIAFAGDLRLASDVTVAGAGATVDARALGILLGFTVAVTAAALVAPLVWLRRVAHVTSAGSNRVARGGVGFRRALMAAQVGAGCVLLAGALLLTRTLTAILDQPPGYERDRVAFAEIDPTGAGLAAGEVAGVIDRALGVRAGAGVEVAVATQLPLSGSDTLFVAGEDSPETRPFPMWVTRIGGPYFDVLGLPIVAGRAFTPADANRRVVIVSEPLVEAYWPGQPALGRVLRIGGPDGDRYEIVGVVPGLRDLGLTARPVPRLYLPIDPTAESVAVLARAPAAGMPPPAQALAVAVSGLDARLVVTRSGALADLVMATIAQRRIARLLTTALGAGALVMIAIGVWGLSHSSVRRRWREFGIRHALGAGRAGVARLALTDAFVVAGAGGAIGLAGAWQFGHVLRGLLFGVTPADPVTLATAVAAVTAAALAGAALPARRAVAIDPAELLRED